MALPPPSVQANAFLQPDDKFWSLYLKDALAYDKVRMERWKGDADGILIFTGLFAATVATFAVSSYTSLSPNTGSQTVMLLSQILASTNTSIVPALAQSNLLTDPETFAVPATVVWINALWFLSLTTAIVSALLATLVQQWTRRFSHDAHRQGPPRLRGPVHVYLDKGLAKFGMEHVVSSTVFLLHVSVAMFFAGLLLYLFSAHAIVAWTTAGGMMIIAATYLVLSIIGIVFAESPYQTPLTPAIQFILQTIVAAIAALLVLLDFVLLGQGEKFLPQFRETSIPHKSGHHAMGPFTRSMRHLARRGKRFFGLPRRIAAVITSRYLRWYRRLRAKSSSTPILYLLSDKRRDIIELRTVGSRGNHWNGMVNSNVQARTTSSDVASAGVMFALLRLLNNADEVHELHGVCEAFAPVLDRIRGILRDDAHLGLVRTAVTKGGILQHATSLLKSCSTPSGLALEEAAFNRRVMACLSLFKTIIDSLRPGFKAYGRDYISEVAAASPTTEGDLLSWPLEEAIDLLRERRSSASTVFLIYCYGVANCVESYELSSGSSLSSAIWKDLAWRYIVLSRDHNASSPTDSAGADHHSTRTAFSTAFAERTIHFERLDRDGAAKPECTDDAPACHVCQLSCFLETLLDLIQSKDSVLLDEHAAVWTPIFTEVSKAVERRLMWYSKTGELPARHPGLVKSMELARRIGFPFNQTDAATRRMDRLATTTLYRDLTARYPKIISSLGKLVAYRNRVHATEMERRKVLRQLLFDRLEEQKGAFNAGIHIPASFIEGPWEFWHPAQTDSSEHGSELWPNLYRISSHADAEVQTWGLDGAAQDENEARVKGKGKGKGKERGKRKGKDKGKGKEVAPASPAEVGGEEWASWWSQSGDYTPPSVQSVLVAPPPPVLGPFDPRSPEFDIWSWE